MDNDSINNITNEDALNKEEPLFCLSEDIEKQINEMKNREQNISSNMEDIMIDLHNNCEFMGKRMSSIVELIKEKTDEEIKASTVNYRKAYDTLIKVAILIGLTNSIIIILLMFILMN